MEIGSDDFQQHPEHPEKRQQIRPQSSQDFRSLRVTADAKPGTKPVSSRILWKRQTMRRKSLTDAVIRSAKAKRARYRLRDGNGLSIEISPRTDGTVGRHWRYRYELGGREYLYALGEWCVAPGGEGTNRQPIAARPGVGGPH